MATITLRSLILSLSVLGCVSIAATQPSPHDDEILVATARYLQTQYRAQRVGLDPRILKMSPAPRSGVYGDTRAAARTDAIAKRVGASVQSKQNAVQCSETPTPRCTLVGLDIVVGLSEPVLSESGATVRATVTWAERPDYRMGTGTKDVMLTLTPSESGWRVTGEQLLRIT